MPSNKKDKIKKKQIVKKYHKSLKEINSASKTSEKLPLFQYDAKLKCYFLVDNLHEDYEFLEHGIFNFT